jgi:hypothetical protein
MPYLSISTQQSPPTESSNDCDRQQLPGHLVERFKHARDKYDKLMPKEEDRAAQHPVVHGSPTLDEAFYHFASDNESKKDEKRRNHSQVVTKQLGKTADQTPTQTSLRVSQIWIWTIDDSMYRENADFIVHFTNRYV